MTEFQNTTTDAKVAAYEASSDVFYGLMREMRELSKKKPEATLSKSKVAILNRILADIGAVLQDEPEAKYLDPLDNDELPQNSDAVLVMVQYQTALASFQKRYRRHIPDLGEHRWITAATVEEILQHRRFDDF